MSNVTPSKKKSVTALMCVVTLLILTSCEATMTNNTPSTSTTTMTSFGSAKTGTKSLDTLGIFEKSLIPKTGFMFLVGGTTSRSITYSVDISNRTLTIVTALDTGRAVDISKDTIKKIKVAEELHNEMARLANLIWKTDKSFGNFPPKSSSVNVRMILVDGESIKDINSYGPPKFEVNELFEICAQYAASR
jgi:hypothetical protein